MKLNHVISTVKRYLCISVILILSFGVYGKTTKTNTAGSWTNAGIWDNGLPGAGDDVVIRHAITYNTSYSVSGTGSLTINNGGSLIDAPGGSTFDLTIENSGQLIVDGTLRIEGDFELKNNSDLFVRSCDTLEVGETTLENNGDIEIDSCAVLIFNGDLGIKNNIDLDAGGFIRVNGDVEIQNNAEILGTGNLSTSGSVDIKNSAEVFGSKVSCPTGPCFYGTGFPLSLRLVSFNAQPNEWGYVVLYWKIHDEEDVLYYEIQKSYDTKDWIEIEQVKPEGSDSYNEYMVETERSFETVYYRLYALETSGRALTSNVEVISGKPDINEVQPGIYPNPAKDRIQVKGDVSSIQIISLEGRVVISTQNPQSFDLSQLSPGLYQVSLLTARGENHHETLIIQ